MTRPVFFERPLAQRVTEDHFVDFGRFGCPRTGLSGLVVLNLGLTKGANGWRTSRLQDANEFGFLGGDLVAAAAGRLIATGAVTKVLFSGDGHPSFLKAFPDYPPEAVVYRREAMQRARQLSSERAAQRDLWVGLETASRNTQQNLLFGPPLIERSLRGSIDMRPVGVLTRHWHVPRCLWRSQLVPTQTSRPLVFISAESIELPYNMVLRAETESLYRSSIGQLRRAREQAGIDEAAQTIEALETVFASLGQYDTMPSSKLGPTGPLARPGANGPRKASSFPAVQLPAFQLSPLDVERG